MRQTTTPEPHMPPTLFAKPAPGALVTHPATGRDIPAEGGWLPDNAHTRRLLASGDITRADPPADPAEANPAKKKAGKA